MKFQIKKEDYEQFLSNTCAACSQNFRNSWITYSMRGNYCFLCNTNIGYLYDYKHKVEAQKGKIRDATHAGKNVSNLTDTLKYYEDSLQKTKDYFPNYVADLGGLFT